MKKRAVIPALLLLGLLFLPLVLRSTDAGIPGLQNPDQEGNTAAAGNVRLTALSAEDWGNKWGAQGTYRSGSETEVDPNDPNVMLLSAMLKQKIEEHTEAVMRGTDCTEETAVPTAIPAEKGKDSKIL
ncbi:MAG: hypothetical protein K2N94_00685 [Lachnospiraceae bacterium]|nr:hypothetical protein [Lachnospiraceae bacterium]